MDGSHWTEIWTTYATVASAVSSLLVAVVAIIGAFYVPRQFKQVERSIRGSTYERLTNESFEVIKFLASRPNSHPYFYEGKEFDRGSPDSEFVLYAAEVVSNFLEHVVLEKTNMTGLDWTVWEKTVIDSYGNSPVVRERLKKYEKWYIPELIEIVGKIRPLSAC
jgi:hypothetical protein